MNDRKASLGEAFPVCDEPYLWEHLSMGHLFCWDSKKTHVRIWKCIFDDNPVEHRCDRHWCRCEWVFWESAKCLLRTDDPLVVRWLSITSAQALCFIFHLYYSNDSRGLAHLRCWNIKALYRIKLCKSQFLPLLSKIANSSIHLYCSLIIRLNYTNFYMNDNICNCWAINCYILLFTSSQLQNKQYPSACFSRFEVRCAPKTRKKSTQSGGRFCKIK